MLVSLPAWAGPDDLHGFVDPCAVAFVEDGSMHCERCVPTHENPALCEQQWQPQGYAKKCHTGFHSAPAEVWCAPKQQPVSSRLVAFGALGALGAILTGAFLFTKRRRRTAK